MFCPNDTRISAQLPDRKNVFWGGVLTGGAADTPMGGGAADTEGGRYAFFGGGGAADTPMGQGYTNPPIRLKASTMKSQSFPKIMRLPM
jgi:hypothetical protein